MRLVEAALRSLRRAAACKCAYALALIACALWAVVPSASSTRTSSEGSQERRAHEWPSEWDGRALRPQALSEVEQRFAQRFPGAIARLTDDRIQLVLRQVDQPTRMLHPAADCYRGVGYRIEAARLEDDARQRRWRCFDAIRDGQTLRVCERIVDTDGQAYTDASSWFWAAMLGRSRGPWLAVTTAQAL